MTAFVGMLDVSQAYRFFIAQDPRPQNCLNRIGISREERYDLRLAILRVSANSARKIPFPPPWSASVKDSVRKSGGGETF